MALIGYARVSARDQAVAAQRDALCKFECARVFEETASGANRERPQLAAALDYRLARSLKQLIETVEMLEARGIGFRSPTDAIDTTTAGGRLELQSTFVGRAGSPRRAWPFRGFPLEAPVGPLG